MINSNKPRAIWILILDFIDNLKFLLSIITTPLLYSCSARAELDFSLKDLKAEVGIAQSNKSGILVSYKSALVLGFLYYRPRGRHIGGDNYYILYAIVILISILTISVMEGHMDRFNILSVYI